MNNFYNSNRYTTLNKSSLTPPNYVFGPVWALLYTLIISSTYIIYKKCNSICLTKETNCQYRYFWCTYFLILYGATYLPKRK